MQSKRLLRFSLILTIAMACLLIGACSNENSEEATQYKKHLTISQLKAYYHTEPQSKLRYPLVKGSLTNMGTRSLSVVEFTIYYRDSYGKVIFVDHAYPVYSSDYSMPATKQLLGPGQRTIFAFKGQNCPASWSEGNVRVEVTKVSFAE